MPDVKFCGMTRAEDVAFAASLGATHVGVIFAGGPRLVTPAQASGILSLRGSARSVGVFGAQPPAEIGAIAREAGLDVVQLHADPDAAAVRAVRTVFAGAVWAVARCEGDRLPEAAAGLFTTADAVVLDAKVPGALGGTGVTLAWDALRDAVHALRRGRPFVLAGGLTPENVAAAATALGPEIVDVSSGVEVTPGVKDHERMRAFRRAARGGDA